MENNGKCDKFHVKTKQRNVKISGEIYRFFKADAVATVSMQPEADLGQLQHPRWSAL